MDIITKPAIEQVFDHITVANLAAACEVSEQAVYKWIKKGYPPAGRCPAIEEAVGGKVSRFDLLPPSFHNRSKRRRNTDKPPAPPSQPQ